MVRKRKRPEESTNQSSRKRRRKRGRPPEVLDRALNGRACPLEETILSLLPRPLPASPSECRCRGAACLGCRGRRHLARGDDPPEYKTLLREVYCFVPPSALLPPGVFHRVGWSQRQIVRHVMEFQNSNVLCTGYSEHSRFSSIGEALCTHSWDLLLDRIGDNLMTFLLRFSYVFLPLTNKIYQQVAGPFLNEMLQGHSVKRQRINYDKKQEKLSCNCAIQPTGTDGLPTTSMNSFKGKFKKRTRLFSWQRRRKLKKLTSHCCYFCALESSDKDAAEFQINRRQIFYNTWSCYSTFPAWHIMNKVKPNNSGAALLMKHIFGMSNEDFQSCVNHGGLCTSNSNCLYRYLLVLLKSLIRNAQHCEHKKLFLKHCPFPTSELYRKDNGGYEAGERKSFSVLKYDKKFIHMQPSSSRARAESHCLPGINLEIEKVCEKKLSDSQIDLAESYSTHHQVVSFIWAVIRSIVPPDLLGDRSIWRALRLNISKFVGLQRFEMFDLSQCLHRLESSQPPFLSQIRISDCCCYKLWVCIGNCSCAKEGSCNSSKSKIRLHNRLFRHWIYWLFSSLVVPVISNYFYVTERQFDKLQVFYYPKPVWMKLADNATVYLKEQNYEQLNDASYMSIIAKRRFGFSRVRFLPKKNKMRIVANTKAPCEIKAYDQNKRSFFVKSVNSSLKELHAILRRVKNENPYALGSSVFGYHDVYQKLYRFHQEIKGALLMVPSVYIVVGDVAKAFDSINQDMLVRVMKDIIPKDEYMLRSYAQVISTKNRMRIVQDYVAHDAESCSNDAIKSEATTRFRSSSAVIIDQGRKKRVKEEELHHLLTEHLKNNILKIGKKFYLQKIGICQGSSISPLLCSFYLGHLERRVIFPYLANSNKQCNAPITNKELAVKRCLLTSRDCMVGPSSNAYQTVKPNEYEAPCSGSSTGLDVFPSGTQNWCQEGHTMTACNNETRDGNLSPPIFLLLRWIDDFLFISTSKQQAASFFRRMERGFKEYNCEMNNKKFGLNFDVGQNSHLQNRLYIGMDGIQFLPWSGLLLNCRTLEIQADYTRYLGIPVSSTITVKTSSSVLFSLKAKLCDYMRPKCHPLFYDSNINSPQIVRLNAYQAFLLCAMKFHCYIRSSRNKIELHPNYLLEAIEKSFRFMYKLINKQMHNMGVYFGFNPSLKLKREEMIWLGLSAYIWVLNKKQSRYKDLLALLRCKISAYGDMNDPSGSLKYAVDDSHSSVFQYIHF
uniref:Telomerase reverse transcriptase n=8 Tax=Scilla peruviana TaxID=65771 RepID=Q1EG41_SCIPE|nr:telomerase reverse transcriptase catalytic subunit [Scilla peruviana]